MEGGREMFSFGYNGLYLARAPNPVDLKKKKKKSICSNPWESLWISHFGNAEFVYLIAPLKI